MYVFVKALWFLDQDSMNEKEASYYVTEIRKVGEECTGHPWEHILKYEAFLSAKWLERDGNHAESAKTMQMAAEKVSPARGILGDIVTEAKAQYENLLKGKEPFKGGKLSYMYR